MFISVVLPAPFSPSSARISPRRSSRSIASFATKAPKRLPMPASVRTSGWLSADKRSGRFGLGVVDVDAEHAVEDLLLFFLDELHHVGRHHLLVHHEARAVMRHEAEGAVVD